MHSNVLPANIITQEIEKATYGMVKILFQTHIRLNITGTCGFVLQISGRYSVYTSLQSSYVSLHRSGRRKPYTVNVYTLQRFRYVEM